MFFLFLNLQIACVIVPIGQKANHVLGLRNAELHGLRLSDVDLENHILHVRRNRLVSKQFGEYEKSPKTKASLLRILFNKAVRYEWIAKNPVCKTKVGASAKNGNISIKPVEEKEVFSLEEVRQFIKLLDELPDDLIYLQTHCHIRRNAKNFSLCTKIFCMDNIRLTDS